MKATIDQGGRVVVPKDVRERLGLTPGAEVELSEVDGRLEISPIPTPMHLEEINGQLVAVAEVELPTLTSDEVRAVIESSRR
jgi:AbrB family looped-hinge helix DNA binding protein